MPEAVNSRHPVYTERTECQDCYKCIRGCPVKAIKVESGCASVVPELCVCCGRCVEICPHDAKKVRNDLPKVQALLASGRKVIVSLAPSFAAEFADITPSQLIAAIKQLGFAGVSETALGAERVTAAVARLLDQTPGRVWISSACPAAVEYLRKYRPEHADRLTPVMSPMLAHGVLLKEHFEPGTAVVFIGPCIAKKHEADSCRDLIDAVLTFEDLRAWFRERRIAAAQLDATPVDSFIPRPAGKGALYPLEGGMIEGVRDRASAAYMSFSGLDTIAAALDGLDRIRPEGAVFIELLACEGGCINGPKTSRPRSLVAKRQRVTQYSHAREAQPVEDINGIGRQYPPTPVEPPDLSDGQLRELLRTLGKLSADDELNCGGCGYDSCREFARAYYLGRTERRMCVTYMRKLAEKKANALMRQMPVGVVVVDDNLRIVECNPRFSRFFPEASEGQDLASAGPFYTLFDQVLRTNEEIIDREIRIGASVFRASIFSVEPHTLVAATFMDVTEPAGRKEQIIQRARQVIQRNLETVQQIAYLIGENAAESEIALHSIVESFSPSSIGDDDEH